MMKASVKKTHIIASTVMVAAMVMGISTHSEAKTKKKPAPAVAADTNVLPDMVLGSPKAKITVLEYGSSACPHCGHWYNTVYADFAKKYIDTGKVRYVFREIPTQNIDYAVYMLARCASTHVSATLPDPKAYFTIVDGFWAQQKAIFDSGDAGPPLKALAKTVGMSEEDDDNCLKNKDLLDKLSANIDKHSKADKVESVPTFFINGKKLEGGNELKDLDAAIADAGKSH